ncbi:MAG: DNA primase [Candidatus Shapirobacteria bacterium]
MDQIEELKQKTDIVELISSFMPLKKAGRNFKGLCPFHSEKTPSFMVSPQLQIFKCFGCDAAGDAIEFLRKYERMDFWEAAEFLANRAGVKLKKTLSAGPDELLRKKLYDLHRQAGDFYHFLLVRHSQGKTALAYLNNRGIKSKAITAFKIGFSSLDPLATAKFLLKKKFTKEEIITSGLGLPSSYQPGELFDRFRGRLVFPLHDHRGNPIAFSGRLIPGLLKNEEKLGKYINSPETPVYHKSRNLFGLWLTKENIKKKNQALVVEGELDLISPWQAGVKNVVALKGTAFTQDQVRLIKRFSDQLILALDEDAAGDRAALRSFQLAQGEGLEVRALDLRGKFKDPDEAVQKNLEFFKKALKKTLPVWDYVIKTMIKKHQTGKKKLSIEAKKKILKESLVFLTQIENEVEKDYYLRKLARLLKVSQLAVLQEAQKLSSKQAPFLAESGPPDLAKEPISLRREITEGYLLGLIFAFSSPAKYLNKKTNSLFKTWRYQRLFNQARSFAKKGKFLPGKFLASLDPELKNPFVEIFIKVQDQGSEEKEISCTVKVLEGLSLKEELEKLSSELALAEKQGLENKVRKLEKKFTALAKNLSCS